MPLVRARARAKDLSVTTVLGKAIPREFVPRLKERARAMAPSVAIAVARITQWPCARAKEEASTPRHLRREARAKAARALVAKAKVTEVRARATVARAKDSQHWMTAGRRQTPGLEAQVGPMPQSGLQRMERSHPGRHQRLGSRQPLAPLLTLGLNGRRAQQQELLREPVQFDL